MLERGAGRTRSTRPFWAIALGVGLPVAAALAAHAVWGGHDLLILALATMALGVTAALDQVSNARVRANRSFASLDALVVHAPIGIAFLDRDLRFLRVNAALGDIAGRAVDEHLGRTLDEVIGRPELATIARSVLETGTPALDVAISGTSRAGRPFNTIAGYYPVPGPDGRIEGVGVVVRDITDVVDADRAREHLVSRVTRLQRITAILAAARTTADVTRAVLDDVRRATEADAAALCSVVGGEIEVIAAVGYPSDGMKQWTQFPVTAEAPFAEAVRTGRVIVASNRQELLERWPDIASAIQPERHAVVAMPLLGAGVVHGAIGLTFDRPIDIDPGDEGFLTAVATQCAEAFLRARLLESEQAARADSEAAGSRLAFLAEASDALAQSLDWTATLHRVAELAVPRLADMAAVYVVEGDTVAALEIVDVDPTRQATIRRMAERWPARLDATIGLGAVARTGEPILVNDLRPEDLRSAARSQEHASALVEVGYGSIIEVAMRANEQIVGVIVLASAPPRRLTEDDLALAAELATRAGQAIVNAELFRDRSRVAATLQASLLPPATPTVPGLEVATRFFAIGEGIDVGGDFYDVFRMGTRAEAQDRWAVVIGDVRGKGTEAASISGAARHAIRAAALHETSPAAILRILNELLLVMAADDDVEPRFCTAVVAVVEPNPTGAHIVLSVGGHPPPMTLRADGTTEVLSVGGSLIGVLADPELHDTVVELMTGDALVLYTDGVTERHAGDRFFDEEGLASVLSRCTGFTAAVLAERIETAARAYVEDAPRDDLAVVVVRAPERVATTTAASTDLPADATAPTLGRRFVAAALDALGLEEQTDVAALLASELVTNALLHATAPFRIHVEGADGHVRVSVSDGSTVEPYVLEPDPERTRGRGMYLVDTLATWWGVQTAPGGKSVWFELHP